MTQFYLEYIYFLGSPCIQGVSRSASFPKLFIQNLAERGTKSKFRRNQILKIALPDFSPDRGTPCTCLIMPCYVAAFITSLVFSGTVHRSKCEPNGPAEGPRMGVITGWSRLEVTCLVPWGDSSRASRRNRPRRRLFLGKSPESFPRKFSFICTGNSRSETALPSRETTF